MKSARVAPHAGAWIEISMFFWSKTATASRPTRARGLKLHGAQARRRRGGVAPHAGAWIEIRKKRRLRFRRQVAPHAGAWIEIKRQGNPCRNAGVAPHAGAWIEIGHAAAIPIVRKSRPTRARGLKYLPKKKYTCPVWSRPTRARGLKCG